MPRSYSCPFQIGLVLVALQTIFGPEKKHQMKPQREVWPIIQKGRKQNCFVDEFDLACKLGALRFSARDNYCQERGILIF